MCALQWLRTGLTLNPRGFAAVTADSAFNTTVSFATETNWQGHGGETTMGHLVQTLAIFVIPAVLCLPMGRRVGNARQGWAALAAVPVLFVAFAIPANMAEQQGNPVFAALGADQSASATQAGGRQHGRQESVLWYQRLHPVCHRDHRCELRRGQSTACTTATRRWAAWCRWF